MNTSRQMTLHISTLSYHYVCYTHTHGLKTVSKGHLLHRIATPFRVRSSERTSIVVQRNSMTCTTGHAGIANAQQDSTLGQTHIHTQTGKSTQERGRLTAALKTAMQFYVDTHTGFTWPKQTKKINNSHIWYCGSHSSLSPHLPPVPSSPSLSFPPSPLRTEKIINAILQ